MKKYLVLFICLLQIWTLHAEGYYCKQIGIDQGLSQSAVTSVIYDGTGALWIGTRFGLNEYRNGKLRSFPDDGSGGIQGTYVYLLHVDGRGQLWTSTDKGLFCYEPAQDAFRMVSENTATCAVNTAEGIIFGMHFGMKSYSYETGQLSGEDGEIYTDYQTLFFHNDVLYSVDRKEGLVRHGKEGQEAIPIENLAGNLVMASALNGDILYLSLLGYGLVGYDLQKRETRLSQPSGMGGLSREPLLALMVLDGKLWMGFDGDSVWIMDLAEHSISPLGLQPVQSGGHVPLSVTTLYPDPHGNIWIGSVRSGLVGLKESPIKAYSLTDKDPSAENVVIWTLASRDGNIYLGTDGSGVWRYHPTSELSCLTSEDKLKVTAIADFDRQYLCLSTYNRGYFLMDRKSGQLRAFTLKDRETNAEECFSSNSPSIYALPDGRILFLAVHTYLYDPRTWKFQQLEDRSDDDGKELIVVGASGNGTLYAYSYAGLFTIDLESMSLNLIYSPGVEVGRMNTAVYHGGLIWFGTNYGLFSFDPRSEKVQKVESSLFSRVSRLESNGADNLWIAADNTLFLSRNGVMEMAGENRGVPANEILSSACTPNGTVYLGGTAGLIEIGADCFFSVEDNKELTLRDASSARIRVPHNYSSLVIAVNLAGADPFERALYRYMLSGASELVTETFEDSISLPALKPGRYRLHVSYLKADGTWSQPQSVAEVRVLPPWYLSVPFIILYVLLGLGIIGLSIDWISRRRISALEAEFRARDKVFTGKMEAFIEEHLSDPQLNVNQLVEHMAMSRATLYYRTNAAFGKGVAEVIEEKRMQKAEELLRSSTLSVLDISEKVGFSTSRYFSTRFKLLHDGQTPLKYRQAHQA
ncbi:MAG: helix-turn-helix domain-containing protein [Bacteroidales bacterium]|nr:helix-turn-helix domain-containing protein [Bacteroidales bacterium]